MSRFPFLAVLLGSAVLAAASYTPPTDFAADERARIRAHLDSVERELRAKDVSQLSPAQRAARERSLDRLQEYWMRGQFPQNTDFPGERVPYFVDRYGTRCAMAYLIEQAGGEALVARVAATHNNARIPELRGDRELGVWLWRNGITLDEAARIQPGYGCCPPGALCFAPGPVCTTTTSASAGYKTTTGVAIAADVVTVALGAKPHRIPSRVAGTIGLVTGALGLAIGMPNFDDGDSRRTYGILNATAGAATMAVGLYRIIRADASAQQPESRVSVGPWLNGRGTVGMAGRATF